MCTFLTDGVDSGLFFSEIFIDLDKKPEASPATKVHATLCLADWKNPFWTVMAGSFGVPILNFDYEDAKEFHFSKKDFMTNKFGKCLVKGVRTFSAKHKFRKANSLKEALKELTK